METNCTKEHSSLTSEEEEEEDDISKCSEKLRINVTDNEEEECSEGSHEDLPQDMKKPKLASKDISSFSFNLPLDIGSPGSDSSLNQPSSDDLKQLEMDKKSVYSHPLFPLLALLFEKCELATRSINSFDSEPGLCSFNKEIEEFVEHQKSLGKPFFTNDPEVDSLMIRAIQVFRIHLLELEKVSELCKDFCQRYISCLRSKMRSDVLLRGTGDPSNGQDTTDLNESSNELTQSHNDLGSTFLSSASSMCSSASTSSSVSCPSPRVANCSPPSSPSLSTSSQRSLNHHSNITPEPDLSSTKSPSPSYLGVNFDQIISPYYRLPVSKYNLNINNFEPPLIAASPKLAQQPDEDNMVHDLSVKKKNVTPTAKNASSNEGLFGKTVKIVNVKDTEDGSATNHKESVIKVKKPYTEKMSSGGHSKRGVLPKQATSIMRSWLFQHIVHPYPTEDEKRAIASQTNLTLLQVNNWFINARRRILQPMLDSANTVHSDLGNNGVQELDLSTKATKNGQHTSHPKKLKSHSQQMNRFWPQSLANIIQTSDLNSKS